MSGILFNVPAMHGLAPSVLCIYRIYPALAHLFKFLYMCMLYLWHLGKQHKRNTYI